MQESKQTEKEEVVPTKASIEQLPLPVLREKLDEKGIVYRASDKKKDLVTALLTGKTTIKVEEKKPAPRIEDTITQKSLPILSPKLEEALKALEAKGLIYEIDEEYSGIKFMAQIPTYANLDQPVNNILATARDAFAKSMPPEVNHTKAM